MKILMINKFLYPRGGAEKYVQGLSKALESGGHEVIFFGTYDEKNTMGNPYGIYAEPADFRTGNVMKAAKYPFRIIYSPSARRKTAELIRLAEPDAVHINNFSFHLTPSVLDAVPEGIPVVMTAHDAQLMCPDHLMYIPSQQKTCQECIKKGNTMPCIRNRCTHGSLVKSVLSAVEGQVYRHAGTYKRIERIICPSAFLRDIFEADPRFAGKTVLMQNFVTPRHAPEDLKQGSYVLYFGRMSKEKGVDNILKAAVAMPETRFVLAGGTDNSETSAEVLGLAESGKYPNVEYAGFMTGTALDRLVAEAKLVIMPSVCYENCPLAVMEAQQLGAAVLVPGYGGAAEMTSGPWIADESPEALEAALRETLGSEGALEAMRADSRERAAKYMDAAGYAEALAGLYRELAAEAA